MDGCSRKSQNNFERIQFNDGDEDLDNFNSPNFSSTPKDAETRTLRLDENAIMTPRIERNNGSSREELRRGLNLSRISVHSNGVSEQCLDYLPECVLDLIRELANEAKRYEKEVDILKSENKRLMVELKVWKETCNQGRMEIESLKNAVSSSEQENQMLTSENKQLSKNIERLKEKYSLLEKNEAQQKHFNHKINTLRRLTDKQREVVYELSDASSQDDCLSLHLLGLNNISTAESETASSSGFSTWRSASTLTEYPLPSSRPIAVDKGIQQLNRRAQNHHTTRELNAQQINTDDHLMTLSRMLRTSKELEQTFQTSVPCESDLKSNWKSRAKDFDKQDF